MEVYILDDLQRRIDVIDLYVSFIWTDRWADSGDFELVVYSNNENRKRLKPGTRLVQPNSKHVMIIDTVENKQDAEGRVLLTATGSSFEHIMHDRVATEGLPDSDWVLNGTAPSIARQIFEAICVNGMLSEGDIIPMLQVGTWNAADEIPEPTLTFSASIPMSTVYEAIKDLCDTYDMGFRILRYEDDDGGSASLVFDIYMGIDRTTAQTQREPVVFSAALDNLASVNELVSTAQEKNVAYVFGLNDTLIVYAEGTDPTISGFDRKVVYVDAKDVEDEPGPALTTILTNKGLDELAKNRSVRAFDGEISRNGHYRYGTHYELGDLVEMRNSDGATNYMRVTEQIFSSDAEGDRSYPTLTAASTITFDSWSYEDHETWGNGSDDEVWGT